MSEEKKASENEAAVSGYFDSLIEDFIPDDIEANPEPDVNIDKDNPPKDIRDFSKFFEDAAAFGSGFQSTIDKAPEELSDGTEESVSFSEKPSEPDNREIITEPVTDEDGMIVIFDEEAGIDATSAQLPAEAQIPEEPPSESYEEENGSPDPLPENNFDADSNISEAAEEAPLPDTENFPEADDIPEDIPEAKPEKRSFIQGIIPWKGDSIAEIIRKLVFIASTGVFIAAGIMLISTLIQSEEMQEEAESIAEMVTTTVATTVNELGETVTVPPTTEERIQHNESVMNSFIELSGNVKGFIELEGCNIYLPVVQGTDNTYYLTHTYDDRKNKAGAIFMDYRCTLSEDYTSPNIVLYGHNQEDGTMFGNLKYYKNNVDFYKKNPIVVFNSEYGIGDYIIFGYFVTNAYESQDSNGEVFHYHDYIETLNNESTFNWYMGQVNERNQIIPPIDVVYGDKLLVLSTCSNEFSDSRFVVFARKVREGEDISAINFSSARLNPNAKQIDWSAILSITEETTSEETTTTTEETTTTTQETTTTSETTTVTTTTPRVTTEDYELMSRLGLAPKVENGTTASIYTTAPSEASETSPEETEPTTSKSGLAPDIKNFTTAPVTEQTTAPVSSDDASSDNGENTETAAAVS
ncbi:MAG: class B sortase [Oscillospiraceae bacterium]|nr:class B sortase [Oscillospiraceae bacterium]